MRFNGWRCSSHSSGISRPIVHLAKIDYSEGGTEISDGISGLEAPMVATPRIEPSADGTSPPEPDPPTFDTVIPDTTPSPISSSFSPTDNKLTRARKVALVVGVVSIGLMLRASAVFPELTPRQIST